MAERVTLARRKAAFRATFFGDKDHAHVDGEIVLAHLQRYARIKDGGLVKAPNGMSDVHATIYRAGLRDMYLTIMLHLGLDESTPFTTEETPDESAQT